MYHYFCTKDGQEIQTHHGSLGQAIDAFLMDASSSDATPLHIADGGYRIILDAGDLRWLYARTWHTEYDRETGEITPR